MKAASISLFKKATKLSTCLAVCAASVASAFSLNYAAYHYATGTEHQNSFNTLTQQGYRMISLSVFGDRSNPRYAATWVQRSGPGQAACHAVNASQYQSIFNDLTDSNSNYIPVIISATGPGNDPVFAGTFEKGTKGFVARFGLVSGSDTNSSTIQYWQKWARDNNYVMVSGSIYGSAGSPVYAAVWHQNTENVAWNYATNDTAASYQERFEAMGQQQARPAIIALSSDNRYFSQWRDDQLGTSVIYRHNLTWQGYQDEFNTWTAQGYYPVHVQGGGTTASPRYAAVFAKQDTPTARQWTMTGNNYLTSAFDNAMKSFMQKYNVRGGQLAVVKNGRLVLARGYTWAEPSYGDTQPTDMFRLASVSKPITSVAIHQLIENGLLTYNTTLNSVNGFTRKDGSAPLDSRFNQVTVNHALTHTGGWNRDTDIDPMFYNTQISTAMSDPLAISKDSIASFMAGRNMQFNPGTQSQYSNFGFSLLGQVIEARTGKTYTNAVKDNVFSPLGASRPRLGRSLLANRATGEVRYYDSVLSLSDSVMSSDQPLVPYVYGGMNIENFDSHGGWIMAAPDLAKLLGAFDLGSRNPVMSTTTANNMWTAPYPSISSTLLRGWYSGNTTGGHPAVGHNGWIRGTSTVAWRRTDDDVSFVVFFNKDTPTLWFTGELGDALNAAANAVTDWPESDLFPSVGIPSFNTLAGSITLEDLTPAQSTKTVTMKILNPNSNTVRATYFVKGGDFSVAPTLSGTFDIKFECSHWLDKRVKNVVLGGAATVNVTLRNGDINNDNVIDDFDLFAFTQDFLSTPNQHGYTDLSENGVVNDFDLFTLTANFLMVGDQ